MIAYNEICEAKKIFENPKYMIQRYFKTPTEKQEIMLDAIANKRNVVSIGGRQCGMTTALAMAVAIELVQNKNITIILSSKNLENARSIADIVMEILDNLPKCNGRNIFINPVKNNKTQIQFDNGNILLIKGFNNIWTAVKGRAITGVFVDLAGYCSDDIFEKTVGSIIPALSVTNNGKMVFGTTASIGNGYFRNLAIDAEKHKNRFTLVTM